MKSDELSMPRSESERPQANALLTLETTIPNGWIDYNDHMTEWQYYRVLSEACENFLRKMGFTEEYRLRGFTFFSVEGHLRNLRECRVGTTLKVFTEVLGTDRFRLHIYQYILDADRDIVVATGEHMLLHVSTRTRKVVVADAYMQECLEQAKLKWPARTLPKGACKTFRSLARSATCSP